MSRLQTWIALVRRPFAALGRPFAALAWIATMVFAAPGAAQNNASPWPQFLGPHRNGISDETNLIDTWPVGGLKEIWRVEAGVGMSGLAIGEGRVVTLYQSARAQFLAAFDAKTGRPLWSISVAPAYKNTMGDGPRATPTIAGDKVFIFTGQGILEAHRLKDGGTIWSHDVVTELGGKPADYGMACSPLVVGDHVIVTPGAPQATVAAYDIKSGELAWKAGNDPAGYSSPALLDVGGREQIVVFTGGSAIGLAPGTGTLLWRYPYVTDYNCNIATPIAFKGNVFISSGEKHGSVLLSLKPVGDRFEVNEVWSSQGPKAVLHNEWQTSILIDGYLYGFDNIGSAGPVTHLVCVDAATGERAWEKLRFGKGNLIAADGKLFITTMDGELVVVRATPKGFEEIGRSVVLDTTRQAPALADGRLYLRDNREIVCLNVREK